MYHCLRRPNDWNAARVRIARSNTDVTQHIFYKKPLSRWNILALKSTFPGFCPARALLTLTFPLPTLADLTCCSPGPYALMHIFDTELTTPKEKHRDAPDLVQDSEKINNLTSSPMPTHSCWFEDLVQMDHEPTMLVDNGNGNGGTEVSPSGVESFDASGVTDDKKVIGVKAGE